MESTTDTLPNAGKVVSVAVGEAHTLALTENGRVHSWGRGMFGRLGIGSEADQLSPVEVNFGISNIKFVGVSAGAYHSLALADDGSVWSWGYNVYGQLGTDGDNSSTPCLLKEFTDESTTTKSESPLKICSVKAGGMMSAAIDHRGSLWIWGNYPQQSTEAVAEGGFCFTSSFTPTPVRGLLGRAVAKVACGNEHVVALVNSSGDNLALLSWGGNKHGQLGLGDTESRACPETVSGFDAESPWKVYEVACGGFHTALLACEKGGNEGLEGGSTCWMFGLGENGQLGLGTTQSSASPRRVKSLPSSPRLVSVGCGLFHTSVVSALGDVWSWGMERGLGLCPDARVSAESGDAVSPLAIPAGEENAKFEHPVQVACGAAHTILVACGGRKLWSWGRGRSGVLGTGKINDCLKPTPIQWPETTKEDEYVKADNAVVEKGSEEVGENSVALRMKLEAMERYASVLHRAIFGKPFKERSVPAWASSGDLDVAKEWEKMLETSGQAELVGLEMFYTSMLSGVKDQLMKRRIREAIKECLGSLAKRI